MDLSRSVVIAGAGHAGASLAVLLRQNGWLGSIVLLGEERISPYQRPPLSKAWLKGDATLQSIRLKEDAIYAQLDIDLRLGVSVTKIDRTNASLTFSDGRSVPYDILVVATGVRPRSLPVPGSNLSGVVTLRSVPDADFLRSAINEGRKLVIIGGGYIGLEVAAATCSLGLRVTVVEREDRLLARVASPEISAFYLAKHQTCGVMFEMGAVVGRLCGEDGRVRAVELGDGRRLDADIVLVGVGGQPNSELAEAADIVCHDGIVVDETCRTNDPAVFAIGDVTRRPLPFAQGEGRLESVQNALEQARRLALHLCGKPEPAIEVPWFWSDQYDTKLQIAGLVQNNPQRILRGVPGEGRFAMFHLSQDGVIKAVEAVNMAGEFMAGRQWISEGRSVSVERIADLSRRIKEIA